MKSKNSKTAILIFSQQFIISFRRQSSHASEADDHKNITLNYTHLKFKSQDRAPKQQLRAVEWKNANGSI